MFFLFLLLTWLCSDNFTLFVRVIVNVSDLNPDYTVFDFGYMVSLEDVCLSFKMILEIDSIVIFRLQRYISDELELRPLNTAVALEYDQIGGST
jgi:hypothetical protein